MQERASRLREEIMVVNKATKQRNNIVDMTKGLAIILMILDHVLMRGRVITSFHMPVFFVMAGFFLKTDNMKLLVKKKVRSLLGVYVSLGILTIFIGLVRLLLFYDYSLADAAFVSFNRLRGLATCRDVWLLWFFVVLFESEIIYACIYRLFSQRIVLRWLIIILLNISGYIISCIYQEVWYKFDTALICVCFVAVGHEMGIRKAGLLDDKKVVDFRKFVALITIWAVGVPFTKLVLALNIYEGYPACILVAIAGSLSVICLCNYLNKWKHCRRVLVVFGENTILIVAVQNICRQFMPWKNMTITLGYTGMFALQIIIVVAAVLCVYGFKKLRDNLICKNAI